MNIVACHLFISNAHLFHVEIITDSHIAFYVREVVEWPHKHSLFKKLWDAQELYEQEHC